jgi:hypothetical protein
VFGIGVVWPTAGNGSLPRCRRQVDLGCIGRLNFKIGHCSEQNRPLTSEIGQYHQGLISEIENGRANPELDALGKIAAALGVHPHELFQK